MTRERDEMSMSGTSPRHIWLVLILFTASFGLAACGDEGGGASPRKSNVRKKRSRRGAAQAKKGGELQFYSKIEDFAADPEEATGLRKPFQGKDFEADPTGDENRDPFQSFVIRQPGVGQTADTGDKASGKQPKRCTNKNLVASNYSLRDLRLVGIVLRGTRSYALFRDSASYGHIVRKGDCLGQEKARVAAIRTGFVSLEVIPEVGVNQQARPAQERAIQLYPEELTVETEP